MSDKRHFSRFLAADPGRLHVAAHSHHFWPDVTFAAQEQCWRDAARLADRKWETVFGEVIPRAQGHVAWLLSLPAPATVAFGPNTHGFVLRLLSLFPPQEAIAHALSGGDDYELCFTAPPSRAEEIEAALEAAATPVRRIGQLSPGQSVVCRRDGEPFTPAVRGFRHF